MMMWTISGVPCELVTFHSSINSVGCLFGIIGLYRVYLSIYISTFYNVYENANVYNYVGSHDCHALIK